MRKYILVILLLLFIVNILCCNEVKNNEEAKKITKNGFFYFLGDKKLETVKDFKIALAPISNSVKLYINSVKFLVTGFVIMTNMMISFSGTIIGLLLGIFYFQFFFGIPIPIIIILFLDGIGNLVNMSFSFYFSKKLKKEAIDLYNNKIDKYNSSKIGLNFNLIKIGLN